MLSQGDTSKPISVQRCADCDKPIPKSGKPGPSKKRCPACAIERSRAAAPRRAAYLIEYRASNPERYRGYALARNAKVKKQRKAIRDALAPPNGFKICTLCKSLKPATVEFFCPRLDRPAGIRSWCRECARQRHERWYRSNPEKVVNYRRRRYQEMGDDIRQEVRRYRADNPDKVRETRRRSWEKIKAANGHQLIRRLMTSQINKSLRTVGSGGKSRRSWQEILGYTAIELARHIERQFTPKMSWANRGTYWELDHIRPIASFNITGVDCQSFLDCWGMHNLRPLPLVENRSKAAQRLHLI